MRVERGVTIPKTDAVSRVIDTGSNGVEKDACVVVGEKN